MNTHKRTCERCAHFAKLSGITGICQGKASPRRSTRFLAIEEACQEFKPQALNCRGDFILNQAPPQPAPKTRTRKRTRI